MRSMRLDCGRVRIATRAELDRYFVRDVRVDYELDRIYLPAEELERFGVDAAALGLGSATPELRALLSVEVGRARALFGETAAAAAGALPAARRGMRFARAAYLSVLGRVEAVDYDVLAHSIRPALRAQAGSACRALAVRTASGTTPDRIHGIGCRSATPSGAGCRDDAAENGRTWDRTRDLSRVKRALSR